MRAAPAAFAALCLRAAAAAAPPARPPAEWGKVVTLNNGVQMPLMALGTWKYDNDTAEEAVTLGYRAGFRNFMTAYGYCNQWGVGRALKKLFASGVKRSDVFVSTMVPPCTLGNMTDANCYNFTQEHITADLDILGLDYVDIVIAHAPDTGPMQGCDAQSCITDWADFRAMSDAMTARRVRAVGVSNYCQDCIECILKHALVPQLNQVQYHVGMGADPIGLVSYLREKNILMQAYSPLASGQVIDMPALKHIGQAFGKNKTAAQVALKWILDKDISVTTKAHDAKYLAEDIDMFSWFLTPYEAAKIDAIPCDESWPFSYCQPSYACGYTFPPRRASADGAEETTGGDQLLPPLRSAGLGVCRPH